MSIRMAEYVSRKGKQGHFVDIIVQTPEGQRHREIRRGFYGMPKGAVKVWAQKREAHLTVYGKEKAAEKAKEIPTLAEFAPRFVQWAKSNHQKPSTIESKESILKTHLVPAFGHLKLNQITAARVAELKIKLSDHHVKTLANILGTLGKLLRVAVEDLEVLDAVPCRIKLPRFRQPSVRFYEPSDCEALIEAGGKVGGQAELVTLLGLDAGLRLGEMIALEQSDVDYRRGAIRIERSERRGHVTLPKSGQGRVVPATPRLLAALAKHRHLRSDRVLWREPAPGQRSTKLERAKVNRNDVVLWVKSAEKRANMKQTGNVHVLRHSYATRLACAGAPARVVQELLGHADLQTSLRYFHLVKGSKEAAVALLSERDRYVIAEAAAEKSEASRGA